jgi:hypothetical protein
MASAPSGILVWLSGVYTVMSSLFRIQIHVDPVLGLRCRFRKVKRRRGGIFLLLRASIDYAGAEASFGAYNFISYPLLRLERVLIGRQLWSGSKVLPGYKQTDEQPTIMIVNSRVFGSKRYL